MMLLTEDGLADTVKPRLEAAKAVPDQIAVLTMMKNQVESQVSISDLSSPTVREALAKQPVRLMVIDPLTAFLPGIDSHRDTDVRQALGVLVSLAERHKMAVVCIMHLNKGQHHSALNRVGGSVAFGALARAAYTVVRHPEDASSRVFGSIKMNVAKRPGDYDFRFSGDEEATCLVWGDSPSKHNAESLLKQDRAQIDGKLKKATDFLSEILEDGPVPATEVLTQGEDEGFSKSTIKRAKTVLAVVAKKKANHWVWSLKESKPKS